MSRKFEVIKIGVPRRARILNTVKEVAGYVPKSVELRRVVRVVDREKRILEVIEPIGTPRPYEFTYLVLLRSSKPWHSQKMIVYMVPESSPPRNAFYYCYEYIASLNTGKSTEKRSLLYLLGTTDFSGTGKISKKIMDNLLNYLKKKNISITYEGPSNLLWKLSILGFHNQF